jgi:hypothetical protein
MAGGRVEPESLVQAGDLEYPADQAGWRDGQAELGVAACYSRSVRGNELKLTCYRDAVNQ